MSRRLGTNMNLLDIVAIMLLLLCILDCQTQLGNSMARSCSMEAKIDPSAFLLGSRVIMPTIVHVGFGQEEQTVGGTSCRMWLCSKSGKKTFLCRGTHSVGSALS